MGFCCQLNFGLYIFIESLWKSRIYFLLVLEAVACLILSCSVTSELLGQLTLVSKQGLWLGAAQSQRQGGLWTQLHGKAIDCAYTAPGQSLAHSPEGQWESTGWPHALLREVVLSRLRCQALWNHTEAFQVTSLGGLCRVRLAPLRGQWLASVKLTELTGLASGCLTVVEPNSFADGLCYLCS